MLGVDVPFSTGNARSWNCSSSLSVTSTSYDPVTRTLFSQTSDCGDNRSWPTEHPVATSCISARAQRQTLPLILVQNVALITIQDTLVGDLWLLVILLLNQALAILVLPVILAQKCLQNLSLPVHRLEQLLSFKLKLICTALRLQSRRLTALNDTSSVRVKQRLSYLPQRSSQLLSLKLKLI